MSKASYGQYCPLAYALDILGEPWTLLIIRELMYEPRTYPSLLQDLPNIGAVLLTKRLTHLERVEVIERITGEPRSANEPYVLTARGRLLEGVLQSLANWGLPFMELPSENEVYSPYWSIMELKGRFLADRAAGLNMVFEIHVDDAVFHLQIANQTLAICVGPANGPEFILKTDPASFILLLRGLLPLREGIQGRRITIEGSLAALSRALDVLGMRDSRPGLPQQQRRLPYSIAQALREEEAADQTEALPVEQKAQNPLRSEKPPDYKPLPTESYFQIELYPAKRTDSKED